MTKLCELEPRQKVMKLICQWLGGDRNYKLIRHPTLPCVSHVLISDLGKSGWFTQYRPNHYLGSREFSQNLVPTNFFDTHTKHRKVQLPKRSRFDAASKMFWKKIFRTFAPVTSVSFVSFVPFTFILESAKNI